MAKVLVVEDEPEMRELLCHNLRGVGMTVLTAATGSEAVSSATQELPDLILLDLTLPEMDGFEVCKQLRRDPRTEWIPIIVVSARSFELDRVLALELGADDYVTKPFSPRELILRIRRSLDRRAPVLRGEECLVFEDLTLDLAAHRVLIAGSEIGLTATEFRILTTLATRRGRVQSRDQLLQDIWGSQSEEVDLRTVDTHIRRLREKLGAEARWIHTVRGVGYRFLAS
jgi:two-component system phosphate regulon response regulator PhoB